MRNCTHNNEEKNMNNFKDLRPKQVATVSSLEALSKIAYDAEEDANWYNIHKMDDDVMTKFIRKY